MIRIVLSLSYAVALWAQTAGPATLPAGTLLQSRLTTDVSSQSMHVGDPVRAVLVAPAVVGDRDVPDHAVLAGHVEFVRPHTVDREAQIRIRFTSLEAAGQTTTLEATVAEVDNAREKVDEAGTVKGPIDQFDTLRGRAELLGLAVLVPELFAVDAAQTRVREGVRVDIAYPAGTDLTLRLIAPATIPQAMLRPRAEPPALPPSWRPVLGQVPFRTAAGTPPRPADVINLAFVGTADAITRAFTGAGWSTASALSLRVDVKSFLAIAEREGYRTAPVSIETLDGRLPDLVFQKQTNTFAQRHHIRLWRRDAIDGVPLWVAAATHDIGVKFVVDERSFTHRVERDIDLERAKITNDLRFGGAGPVYVIDRPGEPHTLVNATEDTMTTDGGLTVIRIGGH